jgi:hypothetical protein
MTAWTLLLISAGPLLLIDPAMFVTLIQWTVYALALGGIAVVLSRILLPQVRLTRAVNSAIEENSIAAAIVAAAVIIFLGILVLSMILWASA